MTPECFQQIVDQLKYQVPNRVGYVESEHPKEVMKGALIAAKIIEERLIQYGIIKRD